MSIKRTDANQLEIVEKLRQIGAVVHPTHMVGNGFPDLVVGYCGTNYLFEVKDGNQPPSKRKLTPDEQIWHDRWKGQVAIVTCWEDAFRAMEIKL